MKPTYFEKIELLYMDGLLKGLVKQKIFGRDSRAVIGLKISSIRQDESSFEEKVDSIEQILHKNLGKPQTSSFWHNISELMVISGKELDEGNAHDLKTILDSQNVTRWQYFILEFILILNGLFLYADICRSSFYEKMLKDYEVGNLRKDNSLSVFWSCITKNDESALSVINRAIKFAGFERNRKKLLFIKEILAVENTFRSLQISHGDEEFFACIHGKNVMLVGPAFSGNINEFLVDHDVLINLNYRGNMSIDKETDSRIVLISYYNEEASRHINNLEDQSFLQSLKFAVFKKIEFGYQKQMKKSKRGRTLESLDGLIIGGQPNMLQETLFDLLHFSPKKISIVGFTLYLGKQIYNQNYAISDRMFVEEKRRLAFSIHNIITQYEFLRFLSNQRLIEVVDDPLKSVLATSRSEYIAEFNRCYG